MASVWQIVRVVNHPGMKKGDMNGSKLLESYSDKTFCWPFRGLGAYSGL